MRKTEIKTAQNNELLIDYIRSYARTMLNQNMGGGTKMLDAHCKDLEAELVKRNILTLEDVNSLNA